MTEALVHAGHEVTLFASGDSATAARLVPVVARALRLDRRMNEVALWHTLLVEEVFARKHELDVVHFHLDYFSSRR